MIWIAFLRGINVSGQKMMKMEKLRESFSDLGFKKVTTYLQSGNVVFETEEKSDSTLRAKIEKKIKKDFGFEVPVLLRSGSQMKNLLKKNPFLKQKIKEDEFLYVTLLEELPARDLMKSLLEIEVSDSFQVLGQEIYLFCKKGYGKTKINNNFFEKKLSVVATTRNWKTMGELLKLSSEKK